MSLVLSDALIVEAVGRNGGYEEVERTVAWSKIANGLGVRKDRAEEIKQRYEDLLKQSAEQDQQEEDNEEDYEVDAILDSRDNNGVTEYLVKWKVSYEDDDEQEAEPGNCSWEPSANLSCPDLLQQFEDKRREDEEQDSSQTAPAAASAAGEGNAQRLKRKAEAITASEGTTGAVMSAGAGTAVGRYKAVVGMTKPAPNHVPSFMVELIDGAKVVVDSATLQEAPLVLLDFYESRLRYVVPNS